MKYLFALPLLLVLSDVSVASHPHSRVVEIPLDPPPATSFPAQGYPPPAQGFPAQSSQFQDYAIQRLSNEVDSLRQRVRELERRLDNDGGW